MSDKNDEIFEEEEIDNIIYLSDEDGNEVAFEFLDIVEYGGEEFVVLLRRPISLNRAKIC